MKCTTPGTALLGWSRLSRTLGGAGLLLASLAATETPPARRFTAEQIHFGSLVRITVYAGESNQAVHAFQAASARIDDLGRRLSDYNPDSELNTLCRQAGRGPVWVSDDLFRVIEASIAVSRATGGAFDVTTGAVNRLWRRAREEARSPDPEALRTALALSGYEKVVLDAETRTVSLQQPGMQLDLGGIAKGFIADEALAVLRAHGLPRALVAVAGDIAAGDPPPGEDAWRIGVDSPPVIALRNRGVSTSGDRERFLEHQGVRYSHIVSPSSGRGLSDDLTVTVVAESAMSADAWATAVRVLGIARAAPLLRERPEITVATAAGAAPGRPESDAAVQ